jgi:flavin reductase (DIM6/NTAB) family NADH-FMN oxidoreductase RutF
MSLILSHGVHTSARAVPGESPEISLQALLIFNLTHLSLLGMIIFLGENNQMTLDPEKLRHAMRAWTTGVAIVTSIYEGQQYGMTVNSFTSISLEPPLISVTLKRLTHTHDLVEKSGLFSVTILTAAQKELSDRFAGKLPSITNRFDGLQTETISLDAPVFKEGMAYFDCRVVSSMPVGENTLFVAEVVDARGEGQGNPLVYHNREYWKLTK